MLALDTLVKGQKLLVTLGSLLLTETLQQRKAQLPKAIDLEILV